MKEDDITNGQTSAAREKEHNENLGKWRLRLHLCSPSKRRIVGPKTIKPGQCTDTETKGNGVCQISAEETEWKMSSRFRNYEVKVQVGKQDGKEQSKVGMENSLTGGCENCGSQAKEKQEWDRCWGWKPVQERLCLERGDLSTFIEGCKSIGERSTLQKEQEGQERSEWAKRYRVRTDRNESQVQTWQPSKRELLIAVVCQRGNIYLSCPPPCFLPSV